MDGLIWGAQDDFIIKNGTLMEVAARLSSPTMADQRINMWLLQHGSLKVVEPYVETQTLQGKDFKRQELKATILPRPGP